MQTLLFTKHLPVNHDIIAERIRQDKPEVYWSETPEHLNDLYDEFVSNHDMNYNDLINRAAEVGYHRFTWNGRQKILYAVRDIGGRIVGVESTPVFNEFAEIYDQFQTQTHMISSLMYSRSAAIKYRGMDKTPPDGYELMPEFALFPLGIDGEIQRFDKILQRYFEMLHEIIEKSIARERGVIENVRGKTDRNTLGYFGFSHRTLPLLMAKEGISIKGEDVGDFSMCPVNKYHMLHKYELLGLDNRGLRHPDITIDCDPALKYSYFDLIPYWITFADELGKNTEAEESIRKFWSNQSKIRKDIDDPDLIIFTKPLSL
ncbi:MAG: hypothetical protein JXC85_04060 [Candidatus Aenigmarchaeota archaeon]|nr:hypothetical protein [Candidatus Aenigmarchaeota archaeon]